jgi:hypothetical protein
MFIVTLFHGNWCTVGAQDRHFLPEEDKRVVLLEEAGWGGPSSCDTGVIRKVLPVVLP